jgi:ABC-type transporter Mla MlaB component
MPLFVPGHGPFPGGKKLSDANSISVDDGREPQFWEKPNMTRDGINGEGTKKKAKRRADPSEAGKDSDKAATIHCSRSGEWLAGDELLAAALDAAHTTSDVTLDLADVDHLDAGTLQILLALANDRQQKGLSLHLVNASPLLSRWFEYAGATARLSPKPQGQP